MAILGILIAGSMAFAQARLVSPVTWGPVAVGGTGCMNNSAQALIKNNKLEILFSDFKIETDSDVGAIQRKNCSLRLPVKLQPGYRLVLSSIETDGSILANTGFLSQLDVSVGIVGGPQSKALLSKKVEVGSLILTKKLLGKEVVSSACGREAMLEMNVSDRVVLSSGMVRAQVKLELKALRTQLSIQKCK